MTRLLHYGLQRSGTNYLEELLRRNFRVRFLNSNADRHSPLQKHCRLYRDKQLIADPQYRNDLVVEKFAQFESLFEEVPDYYLVVSKDPYSWFLSYRNWAQKCGWPEVSHHYIEEYNLFYGGFMKLAAESDRFVFVRYIDLLGDAAGELDRLGEEMALNRRLLARLFRRIPGRVSQSGAFSDSRRAYYLDEQYLQAFSLVELGQLNERLDPAVAAFLGYELRHAAG